jgi:hypothetical protein
MALFMFMVIVVVGLCFYTAPLPAMVHDARIQRALLSDVCWIYPNIRLAN